MLPDLSELTAEELDALIAEAANRRATLVPANSQLRPTSVFPVHDPRWYVQPVAAGTLVQIDHPGLGWLAFTIPPAARLQLMTYLLQQAMPATPEPPAGPGTVH